MISGEREGLEAAVLEAPARADRGEVGTERRREDDAVVPAAAAPARGPLRGWAPIFFFRRNFCIFPFF